MAGLPDEHSVEYILEAIDAVMKTRTQTQPKVILFDIGGVVVSTLSQRLMIWTSVTARCLGIAFYRRSPLHRRNTPLHRPHEHIGGLLRSP